MEKGLEGACIGEVRMLTIPPHLGYGDRGAGGAIPGGATIMFKVEVVEIEGAQPDEL
jgi:FKBP-type peptidyl-prolyl cis-trans isomerase